MGLFWSNSWSLALIFAHMLRKIKPPTCQNLEARFNLFYFL